MSEAKGKTSMGMEQNVEGLLCYVLGFITGIVFFVMEKENKFVRFHAMQSIVVFGAIFVVDIFLSIMNAFIGIHWIFSLLLGLIGLLTLILWLVLMLQAYQGKMFKLPVAGDIAEKNSKPSADSKPDTTNKTDTTPKH
jgi:uncharacterized membrane protein